MGLVWIASPRADWQERSQRLAAVRLPVCADCPACHVGIPLLEAGAEFVPCWAFFTHAGWLHRCAACAGHVHLDPALRN
jgi:hypothetical protein